MRDSNELLLAADQGNCPILAPRDSNADFGTVENSILIHHLETWVGIKNSALSLSGGFQNLFCCSGQVYFPEGPVEQWCPSRLSTWPSFVLYMHLPLGHIIQSNNVPFSVYADAATLNCTCRQNL